MPRHGRAVIPFGKHKGTRLRLLPDAYLSFLTTTFVMTSPEWKWLKDSLIAELKFRGMRWDLAATVEPEVELGPPFKSFLEPRTRKPRKLLGGKPT